MKFKVEKEFEDFLTPLTAEEYNALQRDILKNGCRESLKTWNGILVDGHNRFAICQAIGVDFKTEELSFDSKEDAIVWVVTNQKGRRNLTPFQKTALELKVAPYLRKIAERRMLAGKADPVTNSTQGRAPAVRDVIAKNAGVGSGFVNRVDTILKKGTPEQIAALNRDETSVNKVYTEIRQVDDPTYNAPVIPEPTDEEAEWKTLHNYASVKASDDRMQARYQDMMVRVMGLSSEALLSMSEPQRSLSMQFFMNAFKHMESVIKDIREAASKKEEKVIE